MKEVDVWYMHYYVVPTKVKGILVCDTMEAAEKEMKLLSVWKTYTCMKVTGPYKHEVESK